MQSNLEVEMSASTINDYAGQTSPSMYQKYFSKERYLENVSPTVNDLVYNDLEHEPQFHVKTWIAIASMFLFNTVCTFGVLSPPAVVSGVNETSGAYWTDLFNTAVIHRSQLACPSFANLGTQLAFTCASSSLPCLCFYRRPLSNSQIAAP